MVELRQLVSERIGPVHAGVLLLGETGTGKTLVAEAIHRASPRAHGPFVAVNCAALPNQLIESELFGHERGAFSGADQRKPGQFELASGGTLFLDEIGDLHASAQAKLLQVIQSQRYLPVGGIEPVQVDVRIVAATNRDLEAEAAAGVFRADLFYRLNVVTLNLPPLRMRRDDILPLAGHVLADVCKRMHRELPAFDAEAAETLRGYDWPGNVRELANCVERAVIFAEPTGPIKRCHLPSQLTAARKCPADLPLDPIAKAERNAVIEALARAGSKREAARLLGWYPQKLYSRLKRYGLG